MIGALFLLSACSELELGSHLAKTMGGDTRPTTGDFKVGNPYKIKGETYYPAEKYHFSQTGVASWYGPGFHGKRTANGEIFNRNELTAAHKTLQMPSMVRVTNLDNGKSIIVRVNDRGPFSDNRVIDLSEKAAEVIGMKQAGTARVRIDVMEKESRQVASAARKGLSTRGTELALNRGRKLDAHMALDVAMPVSKPSTNRIAFAQPRLNNSTQMFDSILVSQAYAAPVKKPNYQNASVHPVFVHVGEFVNQDNAYTMRNSLRNIAEPTTVVAMTLPNNTRVYRLKIGPVDNEARANDIIAILSRQGRQASMVVNHQ